jgi:zinc protease
MATGMTFGQAKLVEKVTRKGTDVVIPYEKYVLPNGLTLLVHEDHSDPVVHVDVTYHVGSAREEIGKSGFAHFFEHMMFQGSDHVADEQHFKLVSESGGTLNGSTNRDRTNYYETVPANQLEKMLWLEADRMGFLLDAVTQKKFEIQRSTVKNERGQNYDNRPYGLVSEFAAKNLYPYGHPYSWLTIGYVEDLNRVDVNDLKNFFLRWYGPNNATVTIGGDVKTAEVVKLVEKYFGSIPRGPEVKPTKLAPVKLEGDRYVAMVDNYARLPQLTIAYPVVPNYHPDMAALACLAQVLGQGKNSVLYQQFEKKLNALNASAFSQLTELAGEFSIRITPTPGKSLAHSLATYRAALDSFEVRGATDDDITRFKGSAEAQQINGLQTVSGKVTQLAAFQTFTGNANKIADLVKMYSSVTKADVMRVYHQYIKGKSAVIVSVLTKQMDRAKDVAAADNYVIDSTRYKAPEYGYNGLVYKKPKDNFDRSKVPAAGPGVNVNVPPFWRSEMANGIQVIGTRNDEIPTVTVSIIIPGGHLADGNDISKAGLADFLADMMNEDTKSFTAEAMAVELQKLGSQVNIGSGRDAMSLTITSLKKNLDATLKLAEERLFNPLFTQQSFDRLKRQRTEAFKVVKSQPASIATNVWARLNYGATNMLGISEAGTEATIANIKLVDIKSAYEQRLTSKGTRVVVVGDVNEAEVMPKLAFLGKLPSRLVLQPAVEAAAAVEKTKVYVIDVPRSAQTEFRVGHVLPLTYDATGQFFRASLANFPLGGDFNSRLNLNLREDKGWTYGARSGFSADKYSGDFTFSSGIRADATDSALVEVMKEISNYAANGITDAELAFLKSARGQRDALNYESNGQKANFIGRLLQYNLPANYIQQQNDIMNGMKKEEVSKVAKDLLHPDKMNILLVGDKAKILPGIQKLGYEIVEIDVDGNQLKK